MPRVIESNAPIYFISDAHLGSGPDLERRRTSLVTFLEGLRGRTRQVYILGDLFDFWFEYRTAIPKGHFRVLRALANLADAGATIDFLGGNHDFWCGDHLRHEIGLRVHSQPIAVRHQDRALFLAHGDGIRSGDHGYRLLKSVLRHPLSIALYRALHPDIGIPLACAVSRASRPHSLPFDTLLARYARHLVHPQFAAGIDAVVIGHIHTPTHLIDDRGREFLIIGDWLEHRSYLRLENGRFHLERLGPDDLPQPIPPTPWPVSLRSG